MANKDLNAALDAQFEKKHAVKKVVKKDAKDSFLHKTKEYFCPSVKFTETSIRNDSLTVVRKVESQFVKDIKRFFRFFKSFFVKEKQEEPDVDPSEVRRVMKQKV
ncbi:MAG: hypothetical protein ACMXYK_03465 [Candidatus Woesearchaeota archaeon]